jgi:hypothetical protein
MNMNMNTNANTNNNMTGQQPQYSTLPSYGSLAHILDDPPYPAENRREFRRDLAWERDRERELQLEDTVQRADAQRLLLERQRQEMLRTSDPFPFASFNYEYTSGGDTVMREAPAPAAGAGPGPERESVDDCDSDSAASQDEIEDEAAAAAQCSTLPSGDRNFGTDTVEDKIAAERKRIARAEWVDIHARALAHGHQDRRPEWCDREDSPASAETVDPPRPSTPEDIIPDMHYHEYTMGGEVDWMEWIDKDEPEPMYQSEREEESEVDARHRAAQAMMVHPWNWFAEENEKEKGPEKSRETFAYRKWEASERGLPDGDAEYECPTESPFDSGSETETESECNCQCERERETRSESESRTAENDENDQTETEGDTPLRESHITNLKTSLLTLYPPSQFIKLPLVKEYIARLTLEEMQSILEKHLLPDAHAVLIRRTLATLETRPSGSRRVVWAPEKSALFRQLIPPNVEDTTTVEDFSLIDALRKLDGDKLREAIPGTLELMTTEEIWAVIIAPKVKVVEPVLIELYGAAAAMGLEEGVGFGIGCAEWWERQGATLAEGL